jgi:hypothetical protein
MTTVYFAGGEDTSFSLVSAAGYNSAVVYRSSFCRCAVNVTSSSTTYPPSAYARTPVFASLSSFWTHAGWHNYTTQTSTLNTTLLALQDSSGVGRILVQGTGTNGQLKISTRNAAGTVTTLATTAAGAFPTVGANAVVHFDLFLNYAVSGQAQLWINGVIAADTGPGVNVTTDSATSLAQLLLGSINGSNSFWSEVIVQDTSTIGSALFTIPPVAAGNTQSWTPNTVGDVNPVTINDANFVATTTNNALSEWTVATTLPAGSWTIEAVVQEARVSVGTTGPQHFEWLVRTSDGSDHMTGTVAPSVGSFSNFGPQIWPTNPHTGAAWNPAELINAGVESLA